MAPPAVPPDDTEGRSILYMRAGLRPFFGTYHLRDRGLPRLGILVATFGEATGP
jgi:hypothetical protein